MRASNAALTSGARLSSGHFRANTQPTCPTLAPRFIRPRGLLVSIWLVGTCWPARWLPLCAPRPPPPPVSCGSSLLAARQRIQRAPTGFPATCEPPKVARGRHTEGLVAPDWLRGLQTAPFLQNTVAARSSADAWFCSKTDCSARRRLRAQGCSPRARAFKFGRRTGCRCSVGASLVQRGAPSARAGAPSFLVARAGGCLLSYIDG